MSTEPQEHEVALIIAADNAAEVAASVARATHLAGYALVPRADEQLHDVMVDTPERALQQQGFVLRARQRNGSFLITLKGGGVRDADGGVTRAELELPWSSDSLQKAVAELARAHITLRATDDIDAGRPVESLRGAGLFPIQERRTLRRVRDVLDPHQNVRMAELAIDRVDYQFGSETAQLFEIEIEAKHADAAAALHACTLALQSDFGAMLRPWPYGKLATGAVIEGLLHSGEITALLIDGRLVGAQASLLLEDRLR